VTGELPQVTLSFDNMEVWRRARDALGGGVKGAFRVVQSGSAGAQSSLTTSRSADLVVRKVETPPGSNGDQVDELYLSHEVPIAPVWRSRSVMENIRGRMNEAKKIEASTPPATPAVTPARLTWSATRRVVWSSLDEATAVERLRSCGFSTSACFRAVQIVGEVSDETRRAAQAEWLLQHIEALESERAELVEQTSPWWPSHIASPNYAGTNGQEDGIESKTPVASLETIRDVEDIRHATPGKLLPRDYLERQPRRWRKSQKQRGLMLPQ